MVITLGQQYNVGEKPTVILYTYINQSPCRGTNKREDKPIHHQTIKTNPIQSLLKRAQQRTMMMRIFIIQVHNPVIHLEVDEEQ